MAPRLGEILLKDGACSPQGLRDALQNQVIFGGRLGTNLLELEAVTEEALARALGAQHGLPSLCGDLPVDPRATALLRAEVADRSDAVPYVIADRRLALLVVDPKNLAMLDEVAFATGKQVHPIVAPEARVWALLKREYGVDRQLRAIAVDFDRLPRARPAAPGDAARAEAPKTRDLMDEGEFDAIYGKTASGPAVAAPSPSAAAPPSRPPDDDVVELSDLILPEEAPPAPVAPPIPVDELLARAAGHAPPPRFVPPAARAEEPEPSPLTFPDAVRFLEGVAERNAIARTVLRYARSKFRRAVLLTVNRGAAQGWAGLGEKLGADAVRRLRVALGAPGIVDTVVRTRAHFLGPIPKTEANIRLLKALGGGVPANAFLVPILATGRVVNVFYADNGRGGVVDSGDVGELLILATRIAQSYETLVAKVR